MKTFFDLNKFAKRINANYFRFEVDLGNRDEAKKQQNHLHQHRKHKHQLTTSMTTTVEATSSDTTHKSLEIDRTYSTPPQSPLNSSSSSTKPSDLINVQVDDDPRKLLQIQTPPQSAGSTTNLHFSPDHAKISNATNPAPSIDPLGQLRRNTEKLRENLKMGYQRLRNVQTKCFQSHVAEQLTNILELKEKRVDEAKGLAKALIPSVVYEAGREENRDESTTTTTEESGEDKGSDWWTERRAKIGSEWERVQQKIKLLKSKTRECEDELLTRRMESDSAAIAALSSSLKEAACATTSVQDSVSRCVAFSSNKRHLTLSRSDLVSLDDGSLRQLYLSLKYFSSSYFKMMCWCDLSVSKPKKRKSMVEIERTCIFCHLLKRYEANRIMEAKAKMEKKREELRQANGPDVILADVDAFKQDHSYCKREESVEDECDQVNGHFTTDLIDKPNKKSNRGTKKLLNDLKEYFEGLKRAELDTSEMSAESLEPINCLPDLSHEE